MVSIIDFVQFRQGLSLGAVRKELRPWIGQPPVPVPAFPVLRETAKDRMMVEEAYARTQVAVGGHPYLERERALPLLRARVAALRRTYSHGDQGGHRTSECGVSAFR
jgi:hypothetical protein